MDYSTLKRLVKQHDELYFDLGKPVLADSEYDALYNQLVDKEKLQGWADADSPTLHISATGKINHPHQLYSLKKIFDVSEVPADFDVKLPKLDGVNISATYKNSKLHLLLTRGDGQRGESVIHLANAIIGLPKSLPQNGDQTSVTFVGEVVTDHENVENFRNYVAGALHLKDLEEAKTRGLRLIIHDVLGLQQDFLDRMAYARSLGFTTIDEDEFNEYPQDGIVYRINDYKKCEELGATGKYPRFAVALKEKEFFSGVTHLQDIIWQVGRSGVVTPVGVLEPIVLDSATITRVILHNIAFVLEHKLRRGDLVLIERRITPQFVRVVEASNYEPFTIEDAQRSLNADVRRVGPRLYTSADSQYRLVEHFCKTLNIKGLGKKTIQEMEIKHPLELFDEQNNWEALGKNGDKILEELARPKEYKLILAALGIPNVGRITAERISKAIPKFSDLKQDIQRVEIPGVGSTIIDSIVTWLEVNEDWVLQLPYTLERKNVTEDTITKKVCISGKLDITKSELEEILVSLGYTVSSSVTKDCYALISSGESTSKTEKAIRYGIPIIDYWKQQKIIYNGMF